MHSANPGFSHISPFARTCQAASLLSRVYRNNELRGIDASMRHADANRLHADIRELSNAINIQVREVTESSSSSRNLQLLTARALCFSTFFTLYEEYSCAQNSQTGEIVDASWIEMQRLSIDGLKEVSADASQLAREIWDLVESGEVDNISPLTAHSLYSAAYTYLWYGHETGNRDYQAMARSTRTTLEMLGESWWCASKLIKPFFPQYILRPLPQ